MLKMSYMTPSRLGHQNSMPSSSMQVAVFRNLSSNRQQYQQSLLREQQRRRLLYQEPSENMWMYSPRKLPWNYHPPNLITMPLNSRTSSYPNKPRLTHWTLLNIKPTKSSLGNISRQGRFSLPNPLKQHCSSSSKRRKLGNYAPAKTIGISIAIPSRMPTYPLPSSPTLSTNYEDCRFSSSSTYDEDITTSSLNQRIIGRWPSPSHLGDLNQTLCSFKYVTQQPFSRPLWMDDLSEIILWRAGW